MSKPGIFVSGEAYELTMGRWSRRVGEQFLSWLRLPDSLDWLDIGCGNGAFSEVIASLQNPRSIYGIDPSPNQIAYAQAQPAGRNISYRVGAAENLPFPDASFDVSTMALVLGFLTSPTQATSEMKRVTKEGGTVCAYFWDGFDNIPISPFSKASVELGLAEPTPLRSREATTRPGMCDLWEAQGLRDVQLTSIEIPVAFDSVDDFWNSATALKSSPAVAFLDTATPDDIERVRKWLDKNLPHDSAGRIKFNARVNAIKGVVTRGSW